MFIAPITLEELKEFEKIARTFKFNRSKNPNHTGFRSIVVGVAGEKKFLEFFPSAWTTNSSQVDFDVQSVCSGSVYQLGARLVNVKINIWHKTFMPPKNWRVGVMACELCYLQDDIDLVFAKISLDRLSAYLVGWLPIREFRASAVFVAAGERAGLTQDSHELEISALNPIETLHAPG
jgi:hypothetical protein